MKNQTLKLIDCQDAINEQPILPCDLLAEIKPLLEDYFVGDISFDSESITYSLFNGQRFRITATPFRT